MQVCLKEILVTFFSLLEKMLERQMLFGLTKCHSNSKGHLPSLNNVSPIFSFHLLKAESTR